MWKKILGKVWRKTPHLIRVRLVRATQAKFTVSVGVVVTDSEGKILLLDHVLRPGSGWGIPGGFIETDEQPAVAARRELCEEIGLEIEDIRLFRVRTIKRHVEVLFRARAAEKGKVRSFEINRIGWFESGKMPPEMSRAQKRAIEDILSAETENKG